MPEESNNDTSPIDATPNNSSENQEPEIIPVTQEKPVTTLQQLEGDPVEKTDKITEQEIKELIQSQQILVEDAVIFQNKHDNGVPAEEEVIEPRSKALTESNFSRADTPPPYQPEEEQVTSVTNHKDTNEHVQEDMPYTRSVSYTQSDISSGSSSSKGEPHLSSTDSDATLVNLKDTYVLRAESIPASDSQATLTGIVMPEDMETGEERGQRHNPTSSNRSYTPPAEGNWSIRRDQYERKDSVDEGLSFSYDSQSNSTDALNEQEVEKTTPKEESEVLSTSQISSPR